MRRSAMKRDLRMVSGILLTLLVISPVGADQTGADMISDAGISGGVVAHVGCGSGELTASLRIDESFIVEGLDTDSSHVEHALRHFRSLGLSGSVSASHFDGRHLPYADNLVNLLIVSESSEVGHDELFRVLCPGGVLYVPSKTGGAPEKTIKPWPPAIDQWTHFLYAADNNAVSHDRVVASPRCLQWVSDPVYGRHHDRLASVSAMVSANGRLFSIEDRGPALSINLAADWRLIARDAFNGTTLWELPSRLWQSTSTGFRSGPVQLPRRLVAVDDQVYVALNYGGPLLCRDAASGELLKTYEGTDGVEEILCQDGTLYLVASNNDRENSRRILAIQAESGDLLWENATESANRILPATLTVGDQRLFFHEGKAVVAIDQDTGQVDWRRELPSVDRRPNWLSPTIVFHDGVVLCGDRAAEYPEQWKQYPSLISGMLTHGGLGQVTAVSADDGAELWRTEASECFHGAVDVFVIDDLVWASQGPARFFYERTRPILEKEVGDDFYIEHVAGRDLRTGKVTKTVDAAEAFTLAHHHRCYRNKATDRFIIMGRTGIELINLEGGLSLRHNWTRGMCQYGVMPANGLLYTPPHPCACYNASKLNGFFAYSSRKEAAWNGTTIQRLEKGTEAAESDRLPKTTEPARSDDWPTYRYDNARSGCGETPIADRPSQIWSRVLSGTLSAPTSADGKVFVSDVEGHTVYALDLNTGEQLWTHVAGARVDSPPTYWQDRVYFGSADGRITCLATDDGGLVWRYFAAPQQASIVARNQLESPWPIAGSVLLRDGFVYALAGRSSYLDGGMYFLKLDARTGEPLLTRQIYSRDAETGRQIVDDVDDLYLSGLLYDVPSSRGDSIFLREARLSLDGVMMDEPLSHLYSVGGFLDDTWWHRYYMLFGTRFKNGPGGGLGRSGGAPCGRLLVCDSQRIYGYGESKPNRYRLFCARSDRAEPSALAATAAGTQQRRKKAAMPATIWSNADCPILTRAMLVTGEETEGPANAKRLVLAGPPAAALTDIAALQGRHGGRLVVVDAASGETLSQLSLDAIPVFDGMCAARGRIVVSLASGTIAAFE